MKLLLGGEERELRFNLGTLRHLGELSKSDPLNFKADSDASGLFESVFFVVYAGLKSRYKEECPARALVESWVEEMGIDEATTIINGFKEAFEVKKEAAGEGGGNTQY